MPNWTSFRCPRNRSSAKPRLQPCPTATPINTLYSNNLSTSSSLSTTSPVEYLGARWQKVSDCPFSLCWSALWRRTAETGMCWSFLQAGKRVRPGLGRGLLCVGREPTTMDTGKRWDTWLLNMYFMTTDPAATRRLGGAALPRIPHRWASIPFPCVEWPLFR
jgi:hypothetical protein